MKDLKSLKRDLHRNYGIQEVSILDSFNLFGAPLIVPKSPSDKLALAEDGKRIETRIREAMESIAHVMRRPPLRLRTSNHSKTPK